MNGKKFLAAVIVMTVVAPVIGMTMAKRRHQKEVERAMRIQACHRAYDDQMKLYEGDVRMQYETFCFWYQIVNDEMI